MSDDEFKSIASVKSYIIDVKDISSGSDTEDIDPPIKDNLQTSHNKSNIGNLASGGAKIYRPRICNCIDLLCLYCLDGPNSAKLRQPPEFRRVPIYDELDDSIMCGCCEENILCFSCSRACPGVHINTHQQFYLTGFILIILAIIAAGVAGPVIYILYTSKKLIIGDIIGRIIRREQSRGIYNIEFRQHDDAWLAYVRDIKNNTYITTNTYARARPLVAVSRIHPVRSICHGIANDSAGYNLYLDAVGAGYELEYLIPSRDYGCGVFGLSEYNMYAVSAELYADIREMDEKIRCVWYTMQNSATYRTGATHSELNILTLPDCEIVDGIPRCRAIIKIIYDDHNNIQQYYAAGPNTTALIENIIF